MTRWTTLSESEIAAKSAANRAARMSDKRAVARPFVSAIPIPQKIEIALPWPPTVNHYWLPNFNHSKRISVRGQRFRHEVEKLCKGLACVTGNVSVSVRAYPPDKRKRDLDNLFKSLLDALHHAGAIEDDGLIDRLSIERGNAIAGGQVVVTIAPMQS